MKYFGIIVATLCVLAGGVWAAPITVVNSSFENSVNLWDDIGWEAELPDAGYNQWGHPDPLANGATDGDTVMWGPGYYEGNGPHPKSDGALFQVTNHTIAAGDAFTLTFDGSSYTAGAGWIVTLFYLDGTDRIPLVTVTFADPESNRADVERYMISTEGTAAALDLAYDANTDTWVEGPPTTWVQGVPVVSMGAAIADGVGKKLGIEFHVNTSDLGLHVDNVKLEQAQAAPEPTTMILLTLGASALLTRRR